MCVCIRAGAPYERSGIHLFLYVHICPLAAGSYVTCIFAIQSCGPGTRTFFDLQSGCRACVCSPSLFNFFWEKGGWDFLILNVTVTNSVY